MRAKDFRKIGADEVREYSLTLVVMELFLCLVALLLGAFNFIPKAGPIISSVIMLFLAPPIVFSEVFIAKEVKDKSKPKIEDWFIGFKRYGQAFVVVILESIFVFLWSLLLIVPGIIKALSYSQAKYIAYEDENIAATDSITKSRQLMDGYKWKLFCMNLSYIGWYLLSILTLGILLLWVAPKVRQANYAFYLNILKEKGVNNNVVDAKVETQTKE